MRSGFKVQVYGTIIIQIEINISAGLIPANYKSPHKEQVRIHPDAGRIPPSPDVTISENTVR